MQQLRLRELCQSRAMIEPKITPHTGDRNTYFFYPLYIIITLIFELSSYPPIFVYFFQRVLLQLMHIKSMRYDKKIWYAIAFWATLWHCPQTCRPDYFNNQISRVYHKGPDSPLQNNSAIWPLCFSRRGVVNASRLSNSPTIAPSLFPPFSPRPAFRLSCEKY